MAMTVILRLIPFIVCTAIYFVVWPKPSLLGVICKCLPIICLCGFVLGEIRQRYQRGPSVTPRYHMSILIGLILSCVGDGFLVFINQYFIQGLACFALAHVMYAFAFGASPLKVSLLLPCAFLTGTGYVSFVHQGAVAQELAIFAALYTVLITVMAWRALARLQFFNHLWTWAKMAAFLGALLFGISDLVLAANKFYAPLPVAQPVIMSTYYTAQLGIALSVVSFGNEKKEL